MVSCLEYCDESADTNFACAQGDGAYTATLAKVRDILDKRQHMYAQADLHIPLEGSPGDPSDCGATPAVIAYRSALILS